MFAAIFSGASGEQLRVKVALADEVRTAETGRLARALARDPAVELAGQDPRAATRFAGACAREPPTSAVIRRGAGARSATSTGTGRRRSWSWSIPCARSAAQLVEGLLQKAYFGALPDVALSGVAGVLQDGFVTLTPEQEDELGRELDRLRKDTLDAERAGRSEEGAVASLVERETVAGPVARPRARRLLRGGDRRAVPALLGGARGAVAAGGARDGHPRPACSPAPPA